MLQFIIVYRLKFKNSKNFNFNNIYTLLNDNKVDKHALYNIIYYIILYKDNMYFVSETSQQSFTPLVLGIAVAYTIIII